MRREWAEEDASSEYRRPSLVDREMVEPVYHQVKDVNLYIDLREP